MSDIFHIKSISHLNELFGYKKPNHPLITVVDLSEIEITEEQLYQKIGIPFYNISLKTKSTELCKYGRGYFDLSEGVLYGAAPNQVVEIDEASEKGDMAGWALYFHPDLIQGYSLMDKISEYGFFSYETKEALHLSEKEKETLNSIVAKITEEYDSNIDEFSQDVLVSNIELLINYIKRFYNRQFLTRKGQNSTVLSKFQHLINTYFNSEKIQSEGIPTVRYFAEKMNFSDSYLSDLLKKETGKNTQEHIHYFIIEKSKSRLIDSNLTASEIAFELGFEYPQYFSRLFKKKTGQTPIEYRNQLN